MTNSSYRRSYIGNQHAIITQRRVAGEFAETITKYLLLLTIVMSGAVRAWGQTISVPANDNFSGRLLLNGYTNRVTGSTTGATAEPGEPRQAAQAAQATVWLSWTAPQAGIVTIDTQGSDYDTQIAVFTGTSLDTLTPLIANDDFPGQTWSKVSFPAVAGTAYQIAVDGFDGTTGALVLTQVLNAAPVITNQPSSGVVVAGPGRSFTFNVTAIGTPTLIYQWLRDGAPISGATNAVYTLLNVAPADSGNYHVIITNAYGSVTSSIASLGVVLAVSNDAFATRSLLTGGTNIVAGHNYGATLELDEPNHAGVTNGASVWWTWTAPGNGLVMVNTLGSTNSVGAALDTVLAVYTGNTLGSLVTVAANDDAPGQGSASAVAFRASSGTTYQIAVAGKVSNGTTAVGGIVLSLVQAPDNDFFANRLAFPPGASRVTDNNASASKELNEPDHAQVQGGKSVWWSWIAPSSGDFQLDTSGSSFDTLLAVYSGTNIGALTFVASSDGDPIDNYYISRLTFTAVVGAEYSFAVDGKQGASGDIVINLKPVDAGTVLNNNFTNRVGFSDRSRTFSVNTLAASKESGEPDHAQLTGGKSVWWSWRAPVSGTCRIDTVGSSFDTLLAVYVGTNLASLQSIASNDGDPSDNYQISRLQFHADAGTSYEIAADGFQGAGGRLVLNLALEPDILPGANDMFDNRSLIAGLNATVSGVNTNASKEAGEPNHAGNRGGKSIWWRWVAPQSSPVTIDTIGSKSTDGGDLDTILGVYTGTNVSALTYVAGDDQGLPNAAIVTFNAVQGTEYQIAVDGYRDGTNVAQGSIQVNLRQYPTGPLIANDDFESATPIAAGEPGQIGGTLGATRQPGEPSHAGQRSGHSAWWAYTATDNGPIKISTAGSEFDTTLSVYTGTRLSNLTLVAERDDLPGGNFYAEVEFNAIAGTVYWIAVDGYKGAMGLVRLKVLPVPATNMPPAIYLQPGSQTRFQGSAGGGAVVEFRVVAEGAFPLAYQWQKDGTNLNGETAPTLTLANAGVSQIGTYQVIISNSFGTITSQPVLYTSNNAPFNDHFADRISLVGPSHNVRGSVREATKEPGEPAHGGNDGGRSVWWSWVAPADGLVEIYTYGSSYDTTLAVYTGSTLNNLALVEENDDLLPGRVNASRVVFQAVKNTEYQIAVDGYKTNSVTGNVLLSVRQPPEPPRLLSDLPNALNVVGGGTLSLTPLFGGITPLLKFQWYLNGNRISGETSSNLSAIAASRTNSGTYYIVATNDYGSVTSRQVNAWILAPQHVNRIQPLPDYRARLYFKDTTGELAPDASRMQVQFTVNPTGRQTDWLPASGNITNDGSILIFEEAAGFGSQKRFFRVIER